jgi:leucyl-tRNA synthetase
MILGYSYRYYDDDLKDELHGSATPIGFRDVRQDGETHRHNTTGAELKARWVKQEEVRWENEKPLHPRAEIELEEVTEKMSKSRGNVVNPDDVVARFGTDAMRLYEMFMGPLEKGAPWSDESLPGMHRFLQRAWRLVMGENDEGPESATAAGSGSPEQQRITARAIAGVTADVESLQFNTAISKLMIFSREIAEAGPVPRAAAEAFVLLLCPFAPHLAEELWRALGYRESVALAPWPETDAALLVADSVRLAVQVNGKRRDEILVPADASEDAIRRAALASEKVRQHLRGEPRKVIVVPGRLVNLVG